MQDMAQIITANGLAWAVLAMMAPVGFVLLWPLLSRRWAAAVLLAPVLGWGALTYLFWILGFIGIPYSHAVVVTILLLQLCASLAISFLLYKKHKDKFVSILRAAWPMVWSGLLLFLVAHIFLFSMRLAKPDLYEQEKFMDLAFFNTLTQSSQIPPPDPWLSGYHINYYYGGYMMASVIAKVTGTSPGVGYNLNMCLLYSLAALGAYAIALMLTRRRIVAAISALWVVFFGNLVIVSQLFLQGIPLASINLWKSSRAIVDNGADTINEFPFFSFAEVGDMHPHMMGVPLIFVFLFLALRLMGKREGDWFFFNTPQRWKGMLYLSGLCGLWLAIMGWVNVFDVATFGLFLFTVVFLHRYSSAPRPRIWGIVLTTLLIISIGVLSAVFLLPFLLNFHSPQSGSPIKLTRFKSDLSEYILFWGVHIAVGIIYLTVEVTRFLRKQSYPIKTLLPPLAAVFFTIFLVIWGASGYVVFASLWMSLLLILFLLPTRARPLPEQFALGALFFSLTLLLLCEIIYIVDSYGAQRMNTLFKFFYPVWIVLGATMPALMLSVFRYLRPWFGLRALLCAALALLCALSLVYPINVAKVRWHWRPRPLLRFDGCAHVKQHHATDYKVIEWIRNNTEVGDIILERPGHFAYNNNSGITVLESRISVHTGRPTVIGWINHEQVWRGGEGMRIAGQRTKDVHSIYRNFSFDAIWPLLVKYRVKYIVVAERELSELRIEVQKYPKQGLLKFETEAAKTSGRRLSREFGNPGRGCVYEVHLPKETH
jgi:YYY domain-containing protein